MLESYALESHHHAPIIGYHRAPLSQKFGAPRQPNLVALTSVIEMLAPYDTPAAFVGLEAFSHIWLSWQFHHNYLSKASQVNENGHINKADSNFRAQVRPPRLGGNEKIGVFASRSMYRPSGLGLSVVKLERVEVVQGRVLLVISGADMIDGTPIIDIKPYVAYSDAVDDAESGFAPTAPVLLDVTITESAHEQFLTLINVEQVKIGQSDTTNHQDVGTNNATVSSMVCKIQSQLLISDIDSIKALIAQDPRPAYRRTEINTAFVMRYKTVDVSFQLLKTGQLQITAIVEVD
ncbi:MULTISPECIES: tRNA (N6-threonylcarbamoyladenosine(37)-N6)-methyltransferase TrmO [unclassified Psychrobacter]|uniref:tRNA (N6-threonylcarbamoyladenosine(37)-N6)-methyltransferase TrmO n=1 Tax=unclassified Psychrobacter TaxID=196806 RepID=UPI00071E89BF|nr:MULTISPECIES: tRNA (N6-threonylcarbamoyladenosine(37)-N6)-methyltransferase TrmO [unclassified Psychrobacter]OLF36216.1 tRNA (N6-threonylcarbamoyladenosine(37)-N6)-methyltransferase TrmO [Psychrobacter sp. Cmf 22.2]